MANNVSHITYANTFAQWVISTNQLVGENNDLATGSYYKNQGTLFLNGPVGLYVSNTAGFAGNTTFSGNGAIFSVTNKANFSDVISSTSSLNTVGSISTNTSLISANVYTGDISANNTNSVFGKIDTLNNLNLTSNNIVSNTSTAIIANNTVL